MKASRTTCFNVKWPLRFSRKFVLFRPKKRSINIGRSSIETTKKSSLANSRVLILVEKAKYFLQWNLILVFVFPSVARTTKQMLHNICILVHVTGHSRLTEKKKIFASEKRSPIIGHHSKLQKRPLVSFLVNWQFCFRLKQLRNFFNETSNKMIFKFARNVTVLGNWYYITYV